MNKTLCSFLRECEEANIVTYNADVVEGENTIRVEFDDSADLLKFCKQNDIQTMFVHGFYYEPQADYADKDSVKDRITRFFEKKP